MPFTDKNFSTQDKVKLFQRLGSAAAVLAVALIILIESGYAGSYFEMANIGLTAMIVVLAVSLVGSVYFKRKL
ncbi:hypothetical protein [Fibrobacter sp. UWP2]|jgi:hypothetical protein|uniref:hypothetical protein n=1 Tax=Fibrobacter sp. UWP2 TaxID=1896216 RepID=UPI0009118022|nr:hypothetical protein [Fibrobacter sp. UWP2]SHI67032.1 hypothetical protein SAMN05720471_10573 [Fibrobacter sp. UWP2]